MSQSQVLITSDNKTPLVEIIVWILLTVSILAVVARVATKLTLVGQLRLEDYLITISLLFAAGQSVAAGIQDSNGFGQHIDTLNDGPVSAILKSEYAASTLFIASLCFAKLSVIIFVVSLAKTYKMVTLSLELAIILWAITAEFAILFQCRLPEPWNYIGHACFNRVAFWTYFSVTNILTDCALVSIMFFIAWKIQTSWSKRILIMGVFGSRIFVVAAVGLQIYYSNRALNSGDPTFSLWQASISTQAVQCLSILTACIPYLKPFLESLESGLMRADDLRRRGKVGISGYGSGDRSIPRATNFELSIPSNEANFQSKNSRLRELTNIQRRPEPGYGVTTVTGAEGPSQDWDYQSQRSQAMLIKEIRTWDVDVEGREGNLP